MRHYYKPGEVAVPSQEDIDNQQNLLATNRRTLAHYLKQQADQGGRAFVNVGVLNGIAEARNNIKHVKNTLRTWGVHVEDLPDDEEFSSPPLTPPSEATDNRNTYGIKIIYPKHGADVGKTFKVKGTYSSRPPINSLHIFFENPDTHVFWPESGNIEYKAKQRWEANVGFLDEPTPYEMWVVVVILGRESQGRWQQWRKQMEETNWTQPIEVYPDDVIECDRVKIIRVAEG